MRVRAKYQRPLLARGPRSYEAGTSRRLGEPCLPSGDPQFARFDFLRGHDDGDLVHVLFEIAERVDRVHLGFDRCAFGRRRFQMMFHGDAKSQNGQSSLTASIGVDKSGAAAAAAIFTSATAGPGSVTGAS